MIVTNCKLPETGTITTIPAAANPLTLKSHRGNYDLSNPELNMLISRKVMSEPYKIIGILFTDLEPKTHYELRILIGKVKPRQSEDQENIEYTLSELLTVPAAGTKNSITNQYIKLTSQKIQPEHALFGLLLTHPKKSQVGIKLVIERTPNK